MFPFIKLLNPDMKKARFSILLKEMRENGYRCAGAFEGQKMLAICGFWISPQFFSGRQVELDNLVVSPQIRSKGLGQKMVRWVEKAAKNEGCESSFLKTYVYNYRSHKFYHREGYHILGFGFYKKLDA